ncbi:MAG: LysR substrate-binding domain-containing protein, partial [Heyndrickxia sp.]
HQDVRFHLRQGSYNFLIEGIKRREIDLAFIGPVPTHDPDIHTDILFMEHFVGLIPQDHPFATKDISLRQLENDSFVFFPKGFILRKIAEDACLQSGFRPKIPFEGEDLDAIKGLVSSGMGVTLLPEITLQDNIPKETLVKRISQPDIRRTVGIISPKNRELSPSEKLFYDFVIHYYTILSRQQELD